MIEYFSKLGKRTHSRFRRALTGESDDGVLPDLLEDLLPPALLLDLGRLGESAAADAALAVAVGVLVGLPAPDLVLDLGHHVPGLALHLVLDLAGRAADAAAAARARAVKMIILVINRLFRLKVQLMRSITNDTCAVNK